MKTLPWDSASHLQTAEEVAAYLDAALEDGDTTLFAHALSVVARARDLPSLASQVGVSEDDLRKGLERTPTDLTLVIKLMSLFNVRLRATADGATGFAEERQSAFRTD